jgi:hypothetical protein
LLTRAALFLHQILSMPSVYSWLAPCELQMDPISAADIERDIPRFTDIWFRISEGWHPPAKNVRSKSAPAGRAQKET